MFNKEKFLKKYEKQPVIAYENKINLNPLVSICVQTYQQVNYIGKCLDGILMQKTNFDFEILVGEDESLDGTREVCIEYAKKFPNKIKLFLHSRINNIEVYGRPTPHFSFKYNMYNARGKYIAICEGDDYWIDPLKLQKQVDFLEANPDYGLINSSIKFTGSYDNVESKEENLRFEYFKDRNLWVNAKNATGFTFWDLLDRNMVNTLTVCLKNELMLDYLNKFPEEFFAYDYRIWLHVLSYNKIKYIDEEWAVYRIHDEGISNSKDFFSKRTPLVKQSALIHYLSTINYNKEYINAEIFSRVVSNILKNKHITIAEKKPLIKLFLIHPKLFLYLMKWWVNKLLVKIKF